MLTRPLTWHRFRELNSGDNVRRGMPLPLLRDWLSNSVSIKRNFEDNFSPRIWSARYGQTGNLKPLIANHSLSTLSFAVRNDQTSILRSAFHSDLKFRKFHVSNEAVHSGCTDQTQPTARLVIVLERSRAQKISAGDNTFAKWKGTFRSKSHLQSWSRIFGSDQSEMVRSICRINRNFRNFGLNGKRPRSLSTEIHVYCKRQFVPRD